MRKIKAILTNYRYYLLFIVGAVAMLGIFAVPNDDLPVHTWLYVLVSTKVIGFVAGYIFGRLAKHFEARNSIPELTDFTNNF